MVEVTREKRKLSQKEERSVFPYKMQHLPVGSFAYHGFAINSVGIEPGGSGSCRSSSLQKNKHVHGTNTPPRGYLPPTIHNNHAVTPFKAHARFLGQKT